MGFFLLICFYYTESFCILVEDIWLWYEAQAKILENMQNFQNVKLESRNPFELFNVFSCTGPSCFSPPPAV